MSRIDLKSYKIGENVSFKRKFPQFVTNMHQTHDIVLWYLDYLLTGDVCFYLVYIATSRNAFFDEFPTIWSLTC